MKKLITSHFYNEEYLLPWFLNHHKDMFDHGVMIDYHSTDNSVNIIKEICPTWDIITSRNPDFDCFQVDIEVMDIEKEYSGWWKFCPNVTEFLCGDMSILDDEEDKEFLIPGHCMVDNEPWILPTYDKPLVDQKYHGVHYNEGGWSERHARCIHNKPFKNYTTGRHELSFNTEKLYTMWFGFSPWNDYQINRKLQIQTQIPQNHFDAGYGITHKVNRDALMERFYKLLNLSRNLRIEDKDFKKLSEICLEDNHYLDNKTWHHLTDKEHGHLYCSLFYDKAFSRYRHKKDLSILEIGVLRGASIILWNKYFNNPKIMGLDIVDRKPENPDFALFETFKNTEFRICDAYTSKVANSLGSFDIILDDGSHLADDQCKVLELYVDKLNPGGILIIEDIQDIRSIDRFMSYIGTERYESKVVDIREESGYIDSIIFTVKRK